MNAVEKIRSFFFANTEKFHLSAVRLSDISVLSYAVNQEEYGSQNFLISDRLGFRYIIKKGRYRYFDEINRERIIRLSNVLSGKKSGTVTADLIIGKEIEIFGDRYLLHEYVKAINSYKLLRMWPTRKRLIFLLGLALELSLVLTQFSKESASTFEECKKLRELFREAYDCDEGWVSVLDKAQETLWGEVSDMPITLVHNDLVPSNILVAYKRAVLVDWEYWDMSISIFNFFDVILHFGSLMNASWFYKRTRENFLGVFECKDSRRTCDFLKKCGEHAGKMGYLRYPAEVAQEYFFFYLANKAICQYRTYSYHYRFDLFWFGVLEEYRRSSEKFGLFWNRLLKWETL